MTCKRLLSGRDFAMIIRIDLLWKGLVADLTHKRCYFTGLLKPATYFWKCLTAFQSYEWFISEFMLSQTIIQFLHTEHSNGFSPMWRIVGMPGILCLIQTVLGWKRFVAFTPYVWLLTSKHFHTYLFSNLLSVGTNGCTQDLQLASHQY